MQVSTAIVLEEGINRASIQPLTKVQHRIQNYGYANGLYQGAHSISNNIGPIVQSAKDSDRNNDRQLEDNGFRPAAGFFGGTSM